MAGLLILVALTVGVSPASTSQCAPRDIIIAALERGHGERPLLRGEMDSGYVLEIIMSPNGSSWTILVTRPDNVSCFAAAGSNLLPAIDRKPATPERSP